MDRFSMFQRLLFIFSNCKDSYSFFFFVVAAAYLSISRTMTKDFLCKKIIAFVVRNKYVCDKKQIAIAGRKIHTHTTGITFIQLVVFTRLLLFPLVPFVALGSGSLAFLNVTKINTSILPVQEMAYC